MGNYVKKKWTLDTFHKGDKEFLDGLNHMEQGIADAGSGTGVYKYKGTKENYTDLPASGNEIGDVWNVINAYEHYPAGTNFAWTGTAWDALGGSIDLSVFRKATDQDVIDNGIKDRLAAIEGDYLKAADKTDLQNNINLKQDKLTAGNGISLDNNTVTIKPADRSIYVGEFGVHVPVITTSLDITDNGLAVKLADNTIEAYNSGTGTKGIRVNTNIIQPKLTAGNGIAIDTNNKISADVRTYKSFPSSWPHTAGTTIASFCAAVNASYKSGEIKIGDAFLGNVNSTAFFSGAYLENGGALESAEVSVQIMNPFGQDCVQLLTTTSSNNAPYHWEYTYVDGAISEGWRCWSQHSYVNEKLSSKQDTLSAGTNIEITDNFVSVKIDSIDLSGTIADGAWHDGGTLSQEQANILLASELNYIWLNGMHRLDFKYKDTNNNLATYAATDGEKSHLVEIVLYGKGEKTWRYKHITEAPNEDGTYVWKCVVSGGIKTYQWVKED